jgi:hypothetical protein
MNKRLLLFIGLIGVVGGAYAQDEFDDIYYNPSKDKTSSNYKGTSHGNSYYVKDMGMVDVDAYNRRGESYYMTPIDTIGSAVQNGEDFVYSQKIQKFYNPTIVVSNSDVLSDIIENSYGNVEIVFDGATPSFAYNVGLYDYYYPYYGYTPYFGLGWSGRLYWNLYGPSYSWYNPWYTAWSDPWFNPWYGGYSWYSPWYYGPWFDYGWGWGGGGHHFHDGHWAENHWRPNGNNTVGAGRGWSQNTRAGHRGNNLPVNRGDATAYSGSHRGAAGGGGSYMGSVGNHRVSGTPLSSGASGSSLGGGRSSLGSLTNRYQGTTNRYQGTGTNRYQGTTSGSGAHRGTSTTTTRPANSGSRPSGGYSTPSRGNSSSGNHRSSGGGSVGGGRSSGGGGSHGGGGGGGRHR